MKTGTSVRTAGYRRHYRRNRQTAPSQETTTSGAPPARLLTNNRPVWLYKVPHRIHRGSMTRTPEHHWWRVVKLAPERALPVYTVNEPACVQADQIVVVVTAPPVGPGDLDVLLRCLLPTTPVTTPPPRTHRDGYFTGMSAVWSTDIAALDQDYGNGNLAAAHASGNTGSSIAVTTGSGSQRLEYNCVFFLWYTGSWGRQVPQIG